MIIFPSVGTISLKQKQTKKSTSTTTPKISPSRDKGYVVENHLKHQSDFLKKTWENKSLNYSIRFSQPNSFRGGKLDDNKHNFL